MKGRFFPFFMLQIFVLSGLNTVCAEPVIFTPRENAIFTTLNQFQEREEAIGDSIMEAQLRLAELGAYERKAALQQEEKKSFLLDELTNRIHPYLMLEVLFDDNIDLVEDPRRTTLINTYKPGFKMNFTGEKGTLNLDTYWRYKRHNNRSSQNLKEAYLSGLLNWRLGRFNLSLSESYTYDLLMQGKADETDTAEEADIRWKNNSVVTLGRYFNRTGFDLKYNRVETRYDRDFKAEGKVEQTYNFNQYLRLASKTRLLFEYERFRAIYPFDHPAPDDYNRQVYTLTATTIPLAKLSVLLKGYYRSVKFKVSDDYQDIFAEGSLGYMLSGRTDFAFDYQWDNHRTATTANNYIRNYFRITGNHRLAFNPKLRLSFSGDLDYYSYPKRLIHPNPERQKYYIFGCGLTYAFKQWLDFKLDWEYKKYKTNVNTTDIDNDYFRNKVTFKAEARF